MDLSLNSRHVSVCKVRALFPIFFSQPRTLRILLLSTLWRCNTSIDARDYTVLSSTSLLLDFPLSHRQFPVPSDCRTCPIYSCLSPLGQVVPSCCYWMGIIGSSASVKYSLGEVVVSCHQLSCSSPTWFKGIIFPVCQTHMLNDYFIGSWYFFATDLYFPDETFSSLVGG